MIDVWASIFLLLLRNETVCFNTALKRASVSRRDTPKQKEKNKIYNESQMELSTYYT